MFTRRQKAASLTEYGLMVGLIALLLLASLSSVGTTLTDLFGFIGNNLNQTHSSNGAASPTPLPEEDDDTIYASCADALSQNPSASDGIYQISLSSGDQSVYCDMTTDGGGWMLVSHVSDRDSRDDIPDNSGGAAWGDPNTTPDADTSFNLSPADTGSATESFFDWRYPLFGDAYTHTAPITVAQQRFNWTTTDGALIYDLGYTTQEQGRISGVFGGLRANADDGAIRGINQNCGGGSYNVVGVHYWGNGNVIAFSTQSGAELHNLLDGYNRAPEFDQGVSYGCGTRNAILNIWVR